MDAKAIEALSLVIQHDTPHALDHALQRTRSLEAEVGELREALERAGLRASGGLLVYRNGQRLRDVLRDRSETAIDLASSVVSRVSMVEQLHLACHTCPTRERLIEAVQDLATPYLDTPYQYLPIFDPIYDT